MKQRYVFRTLLVLSFLYFTNLEAQSFLFGTTINGGDEYGTIFKTDSAANNLQTLCTFAPNNPGYASFRGKFYEDAGNNLLYGVAYGGGVFGGGVIYTYNYTTHVLTKKLELNTKGWVTGFTAAPNGKLYGVVEGLYFGTKSSIYEYDIVSNSMSLKYLMDTIDGIRPRDILTLDQNGKFIGTTTTGGAFNLGTIFEYDYPANVFTKKMDIDTSLGCQILGNLVFAPNGKYYGTAT